jgi:predicted RNase H-like nuclease (RuvC/YqgF family)
MNITHDGEDLFKEIRDEQKARFAEEYESFWGNQYHQLKKEHHQLQTDYNAKTIDCNDLSAIVREQAEALEQLKAHLRNSEELRELEIKQKKELKNKWLKSRAEVEELKQNKPININYGDITL